MPIYELERNSKMDCVWSQKSMKKPHWKTLGKNYFPWRARHINGANY